MDQAEEAPRGSHRRPSRGAPSRTRWIVAGASAAVLAAAVAVAVVFGAGVFSPASNTAQLTAPEQSSAPSSEVRTVAPERAEVSVEIPSTETMPYTEVWDPPDAGESFWQIVDPENGYPADGGTDYVIAHSCDDGVCAGNEVAKLEAGDRIEYAGAGYTVQRSSEVAKTEIGDADIWEHVDGRLVLVTCVIETTWQASTENQVVVAVRDS